MYTKIRKKLMKKKYLKTSNIYVENINFVNIEKEEEISNNEKKQKEDFLIFKFNENNNNDNKDIGEMLIKNANDFIIEDDFLLNENEYNLPDIDTDDFIDDYFEENENTRYFEEKELMEKLNTNFEYKMSNFLVLKPTVKEKKKKK